MRRPLTVLLAALAIAGCKKQETPGLVAQPATAPGAGTIRGKVLEQLQAQQTTYLKLQTAEGERWAAVPQTTLKEGAEVVVNVSMPMKNFESSALDRKFDVVYIGQLAGGGGASQPGPAAGAEARPMPQGHPDLGGGMGEGIPPHDGEMGEATPAHGGAMSAGAAEIGDVKVPKATGPDARTVAEIFAQRASLGEKPVTLRGKVVKYNQGIMGKNWVHLRDGTGKPGADDVTVTTQDATAIGQVVVVKGTVRLDRNIGMGTPYPVLIEDARIVK